MRTFNEWMAEYGVSHKHPTNQIIHKIFVPLIMLSVIGIIWSIPTPDFFKTVPYLNWATIFSLGCLIFYISLNFLMFLGMLFLTSLMCFICQQLCSLGFEFGDGLLRCRIDVSDLLVLSDTDLGKRRVMLHFCRVQSLLLLGF